MRHLLQFEFLEKGGADRKDFAEISVRLPEVLAERQQDHMLVVRVQAIGVLGSPERVSGPPQDPLLTTNNANQFTLVRFLSVPRHRAIHPWSQGGSSGTGLIPGGAMSCRRFYLPRMSFFRGFLLSSLTDFFMYVQAHVQHGLLPHRVSPTSISAEDHV